MKLFSRAVTAVSVTAAVFALGAGPAFATSESHHDIGEPRFGADHAVFVQTDDVNGNAIVAYHRADDGSLSPAGSYATGGNGGVLAGSVVDHLASQGSLAYDARHGLLLAVNAGSNTVSVFSAFGDHLALRSVVPSGGDFPVSVAVHGDTAFVLNARSGGSVQGYVIAGDRLVRLPWAHRALGLDASATPEFTHTPGQVAFTPDGSHLIVTTKANGNDIDVFRVGPFGLLSQPVVNAEPGTVPFAVTFDASGNLVVAEVGPNALATYALHGDGTLALLATVPTGQKATCWVAGFGGQFYVSNAASATVSRFQSGSGGALTLLDQTGTTGGTVDAAVSAAARVLYVQTGAAGEVNAFHINGDGSLAHIGDVVVPSAVGGEGIVAI